MIQFNQFAEDLRKWFDKDHPEGDWKRINSKGEVIGPCAREPGEAKPKCMSKEKRASLSKKQRASAVRAKRRHDPDAERQGAPINVSNFGKGKLGEAMQDLEEKSIPTSPDKWARAKAQAKAKFDVYPSAYANGWAAKKYKEMGGSWTTRSEQTETPQKKSFSQVREACWTGYKQAGTKKKGDRQVPNCVPEETNLDESGGEVVYKQGADHIERYGDNYATYKNGVKKTFYTSLEAAKLALSEDLQTLSADQQFDIIENHVQLLALEQNCDAEDIWQRLEVVADSDLLEAAVDGRGLKSSTGGLTQKGRDHFNRQTGGNLQAPVTTPPGKLKPGSKAANRRKSFCARMGGNPGPMKDEKGRPTRKALALRKWNC